MGPKLIRYKAIYENGTHHYIDIHIGKDMDEIDGFIMAARAAKDLYPYSMLVQITLAMAADTKEKLQETAELCRPKDK